jgi:hypothetical protein
MRMAKIRHAHFNLWILSEIVLRQTRMALIEDSERTVDYAAIFALLCLYIAT